MNKKARPKFLSVIDNTTTHCSTADDTHIALLSAILKDVIGKQTRVKRKCISAPYAELRGRNPKAFCFGSKFDFCKITTTKKGFYPVTYGSLIVMRDTVSSFLLFFF